MQRINKGDAMEYDAAEVTIDIWPVDRTTKKMIPAAPTPVAGKLKE